MGRPNAVDQKLQSVLYIMGGDLGKSGIDGDSGPKTFEAMKKAADKIYAGMAGSSTAAEAISTVQNREIGSREDMRKVVTDKLKDPAFRAAALEKLKEIQPPTKDSIIAMQTVLQAAGHNIPRDPVTGMVTGKMDRATEFALNNTENGKPNAAAYAAVGVPDSAIQVAMNGGGGALAQNFADAKSAVKPLEGAPAIAAQVARVAPVQSRDM